MVELLVVIAIIAILAGLLLPGVQSVREAARSTECANNLRQTGMAIHGYESARKVLPPGFVDPLESGEPGWGWASHLLPFLVGGRVQQGIRFDKGIADPVHAETRVIFLSVFACPSDDGRHIFDLPAGAGHDHKRFLFPIAKSNYAGVFGTFDIHAAPHDGDGIFYGNSTTRLRDVRDGLGSTLMIGERSSKLGQSIWHGNIPQAKARFARFLGIAGQHALNHPRAHFAEFRSNHPGGAHFLKADSSVFFVSENVDEALFRDMATRDGEQVPPIDYSP